MYKFGLFSTCENVVIDLLRRRFLVQTNLGKNNIKNKQYLTKYIIPNVLLRVFYTLHFKDFCNNLSMFVYLSIILVSIKQYK